MSNEEIAEKIREHIVPIFSTPHSANQAMLETLEECEKYDMPKGIITQLLMRYTNAVIETIAKDIENAHD